MVLRLIYFDMAGRAQAVRMALTYAGVEFEDVRWTRAKFVEEKENLPFGMLPVMEVDGKMLTQANAIYHYVAATTNLAGSSNWEQAQMHEIFNVLDDITGKLMPSLRESDPVKKVEMRKELIAQGWGQWWVKLEKLFERNGGTGHSVGDKLSMADFTIYATLSWLAFSGVVDGMPSNIVDGCPNICKLVKEIDGISKLSAFTEFSRKRSA